MHIIIITSSTNRSGGTRQALYQARGLHARGHKVDLCLPANSSFWQDKPQVYWHRLPEDRKKWSVLVENLLSKTKHGQDRAIVHGFHNFAVKFLAWNGLFWKKQAVCVAHRGLVTRPKNPLPYLSPAIKAFVVNSRACGRAISIYAPKNKIIYIANAVPDERISPVQDSIVLRQQLGLEKGEAVFVYVGGNSPVKGADILLAAFARANLSDTRLILLGPDENIWQEKITALGLNGRILLMGQVENVSDYLQLGDAFIFPSRSDSAPNALLEAMRMGLPVIATRVGGVSEIVEGNGLLIEPENMEALISALKIMAHDKEKRRVWAQKSYELGKKYAPNVRLDALELLYKRLLDR